MLIKIIKNDFKISIVSSNKLVNLIVNILKHVFLFMGIYNVSGLLKTRTDSKLFTTLIFNIVIVLVYLVNLIVRKIILEDIRNDSVIMFLKKERLSYIKGKIALFIIKSILVILIPLILPAVLHKELISALVVVALVSIIYYLLNMILIFGLSYFESKLTSSKSIRFLYFVMAIVLLMLFIAITSYITTTIVFLALKEKTINFIPDVEKFNLLSLAFLVILVLFIMYHNIFKILRGKTYIFFKEIDSSAKSQSQWGHKLITSKVLRDKIFIKDIICFLRKKFMLKNITFIIQGLIVATIVYFYFNVEFPINRIPIVNLIITIELIPIISICTLTNFRDLKMDEELDLLKQFKIDVSIKNLIVAKGNFFFVISIAPILLALGVIFIKDMGRNFVYEMAYTILPMIFLGRFLCISVIKIIYGKGILKETKIMILLAIIVLNIALSILGMNPDNTVLFKNIINIGTDFINLSAYYIEIAGIVIFKKRWQYVRNQRT